MITAIYEWAKYVARQDDIITSQEFNEAIEKLIEGSCEEKGLNSLYSPIQHLFETNPLSREDYVFKIKDENGRERDITSEEMKYIMLPKTGLTGKAKQSIGGSRFANTTLKKAVTEADGKFYKDKKKVSIIPENSLVIFWRRRLLDTYFQSIEKEKLIGEESICPFCGVKHKFRNLRFNPPVNIFVENVTNFNSYLFNEPSHSICPYCNMLFLRTVVEEKGLQKIPFPAVKNANAFIYILPYDPENEKIYEMMDKNKAEEFLRKELENVGMQFKKLDALNYLLSIPYFFYKNLPYSLMATFKPSIYVIFASKTNPNQPEEVRDYFIVTRFDYLSIVGERVYEYGGIKEIYEFQKRLEYFVHKSKPDQKINGYKLIFRFIGKMLTDGEIDFTFLHSILRKEIMEKKRKRDKKKEDDNIYIGGYKYLKAFLEAKKEV